jgi:archaellum component FlaC
MGGLAALKKRLNDLNDDKGKILKKKNYYSDLKNDIGRYSEAFGNGDGFEGGFENAWNVLQESYKSSYMKKFEESYNSIDSLFKTLNSNFSKHIEELDGRIRSLNEELEGIENDISEVEYQIENYDEDEDG